MIYLLPFAMAILNRLRGSGVLNDWLSRISKFLVPLLIFLSCTDASSITVFICILASYLLGESLGWGKWIATLCDRQPRYNEQEGHTYFYFFGFLIDFWDGIHHIANLIVNEKKDFLNYSRVALVIRGFYWWFPVMSVLKFFSYISWIEFGYALFLLSVYFPLCIEYARFRFIKMNFVENYWEKAELNYGFVYGVVFLLLAVF